MESNSQSAAKQEKTASVTVWLFTVTIQPFRSGLPISEISIKRILTMVYGLKYQFSPSNMHQFWLWSLQHSTRFESLKGKVAFGPCFGSSPCNLQIMLVHIDVSSWNSDYIRTDSNMTSITRIKANTTMIKRKTPMFHELDFFRDWTEKIVYYKN